ncbi:2-octaprenyl-6-methoxyphenyl hydroxylase, partial [Pseudomonas syringae pv. tagetis]
ILGGTRWAAFVVRGRARGFVVPYGWVCLGLWGGLDPDVCCWRVPAEVWHMQPLANGYGLWVSVESEVDCDLGVLGVGGRSSLREQL